LAIVLAGAVLGAPAGAFADSGGYRRPSISAPSTSGWRGGGWSAPSSGGYRRPSTYGSGYASSSAGDLAISRSGSAEALRQYRTAQQPRRPPPTTYSVLSGDIWGGGYTTRRPSSYGAPYGFGGGFGSAAFWAALGALSASDRAAYFRQSESDPAYRQWHQQAVQDPAVAARLSAMGAPAMAAPASAGTASGSGLVWVVLFIAVAAFLLLWFARRRAASRPASAAPRAVAGSSATRFRVGQTIPLDPAPFLLAAGATKIQPPPAGGGMISVEAVGVLEDSGVRLDRLYLPGRTAFFQLHLDGAGAPDECRYFSRIDEVAPASQSEWGEWLDPGQGMIGWPAFQTKDGKTYARAWAPGQSRIPPRQQTETIQTLDRVTRRQLQAMLYATPTGLAPPAPQSEYIAVAAVEDGGQAWVEIHAGIDVNPAALNLAAVPL
jgi:hypothetical protein